MRMVKGRGKIKVKSENYFGSQGKRGKNHNKGTKRHLISLQTALCTKWSNAIHVNNISYRIGQPVLEYSGYLNRLRLSREDCGCSESHWTLARWPCPSSEGTWRVHVLCWPFCLFPSLTSTTRSSSDALQGRYAAPELEVSSLPSPVLLFSEDPLPRKASHVYLSLCWSAFHDSKNTIFVHKEISSIHYGIKILDFPPTRLASCVGIPLPTSHPRPGWLCQAIICSVTMECVWFSTISSPFLCFIPACPLHT